MEVEPCLHPEGVQYLHHLWTRMRKKRLHPLQVHLEERHQEVQNQEDPVWVDHHLEVQALEDQSPEVPVWVGHHLEDPHLEDHRLVDQVLGDRQRVDPEVPVDPVLEVEEDQMQVVALEYHSNQLIPQS